MSEKNERAFPTDRHQALQPGLTKREWFAGLALQGLLANTDHSQDDSDEAVDLAIYLADTMIRALNE